MTFDPKLVRTAEISGREVAKLLKVSHVTAINWMNEKYQPKAAIEIRVGNFIKLLQRAVDSGDLPLKETPRASRLSAIIRALKKQTT